jgi:hypothetical protein
MIRIRVSQLGGRPDGSYDRCRFDGRSGADGLGDPAAQVTRPVNPPVRNPSSSSAIRATSFNASMFCSLTFPSYPEFNQTVTVQHDGYVNLQNAASVHVQGLTVPEMIDALQTAYAHVLHRPIINVDLEEFQKPFFTVSGQLGKSGQYEFRSDITVAEGLGVAGGMAPTAKTRVFLFTEPPQSGSQSE